MIRRMYMAIPPSPLNYNILLYISIVNLYFSPFYDGKNYNLNTRNYPLIVETIWKHSLDLAFIKDLFPRVGARLSRDNQLIRSIDHNLCE